MHVKWVQFPQELQETEPIVLRLEVIGHVHLWLGPGLLSMSPARRSFREMHAGEAFLGVEKMCCVGGFFSLKEIGTCPGDRSPSQVLDGVLLVEYTSEVHHVEVVMD